MFLSKLQILGFKSFAQKTKLEFTNGISCIIGPNGSGKSNIVDAIRWVLGEQRTSLMRSDKMENVIFSGTNTRKPMGMAEVSMTIENNKNILKTEYDEVVVARRLYRSGESQYLINNNPVRLKDVLDLFMDTGMGSNSYSVIELKMVESILSENKVERRQLFEEAAGVVKYKIRRRSALRKLEATRIDLNRINDIISEVQKTVNSLSRQVGKARRYLSYNEELKKTEIDLSRFRYHHLLDTIRPLEIQLKEVSKLKEESHHQITIDEALLEDYKRELIKIEQNLQNLNRQMHELDSRVAQIKQDEAVARTKKEEMSKTRQRYLLEIEDAHKKIHLLNENLQQFQDELNELTSRKEVFDNELSRVESERQAELETLQKEKADIDQLNNRFRQQLQGLSAQKDNLKQLEYQIQFQNEQLAEMTEQAQSRKSEAARLEKDIEAILIAKNDQAGALKSAADALEKLVLEENAVRLDLDGLARDKNKILSELESARSRLNFFEQIIASYEGHSKTTQYVMSEKAQIKGLHGPLADFLSIDPQYAQALEILLGDTLNYLIVDTLEGATSVIEMVRSRQKGRITLIPLDRVVTHSVPTPPADIDRESIKLLPELIECDQAYRPLVRILLGDVAIVNDLPTAIRLSSQYPALRFITPQGEQVNFNREISGGSSDRKQTSIIGRKDQLKKYRKLVARLESEESEMQDRINQCQLRLDELLKKQSALKHDIESKRLALTETEKKESQLRYELSKLNAEESRSAERLDALKEEILNLVQNKENLSAEVSSAQNMLNDLERETISRTNSYDEKNESLQVLLEEVQQARLNATNINNQVMNRDNDINRTRRTIADLQQGIERKNAEIDQIKETLSRIESEEISRREELEQIWTVRDKYENDREKIEQQHQEVKDKILETEEQTKKYRRQHDSSLEKSRSLELQINENKLKAENIREHILKEYSEDVEIGIPFDELDEQEAEDKIESLKNRIKSLGPVNPLAVSEYDKEKERLDFLTRQRDDLLSAEKSLIETINKINKTARKQFVDTFTTIKENFERVFKSFFENGEGTIFLSPDEDPLEADIEIQVRTKGKRLQTLSLLSGGEKTLTAISLLFAIYLVKPSPFCILDEVDAPLDDVNIGRFTEALRNFSDNTQFIVVTHNKSTMEAASTMYGVTMEEEGVSKLVSVKFT